MSWCPGFEFRGTRRLQTAVRDRITRAAEDQIKTIAAQLTASQASP